LIRIESIGARSILKLPHKHGRNLTVLAPSPPSDADLVRRYNELRAYKEEEEKLLAEKLKLCTEGMEAIKGEMLRRLNERSPDVTKKANSKTEHGTAFRVRHVRAKVVSNDFLDFCLENWEKGGSDMLKVEAVTAGFADEKGAFYEYVLSHRDEQGNEQFPPGLEVERTVTVNIRKA
jgi:hypothetical protein